MQLTDRRYREFYAQRMVVDPDKRTRRANKVAAASPRYDPGVVAGVDEVFSALDNVGYARTPGFGTPQMAREICGFFADKTCSDPYYPERGRFNPPNDVPKGVHVAYFDAELVVQTPHIFEIVNNPVVLGAVARILGAKPTISYMAVWWSLPAGDGTAQQAENFHRDFDDWRFVKYYCLPHGRRRGLRTAYLHSRLAQAKQAPADPPLYGGRDCRSVRGRQRKAFRRPGRNEFP